METVEGSYIFYDTGLAACSPQDETIIGESCPDFLFRDLSNVVETWECDGLATFNETVDDVIKANANLNFFSIATTNYGTDLSGEGPYTVFAPTSNALTNVYPNISIFGFIDPPDNYAATIDNHVVEGLYLSSDLSDGQILTSLSGKELVVSKNDNGNFINGAQVILADNETTNGVVHVIDKVLVLEPILTDYPWLESIINFEECTNESVSVYQAGAYFYVYIEGSDNNGQLYTRSGQSFCSDEGDFSCLETYRVSNLIDGWTCPNFVEPTPQTVVDVIVESEDHTTLENAVVTAGLAETLSGEGPFTVFAPTDDAFRALPPSSLGALFVNTSSGLTDLLLYHVLGANVLSSNLSNGQVATTLGGADINVRITDAGVLINDALVTVVDIITDNGVVHVIDAVLLPPPPEQATVFDIIANSVQHNIFEEILSASNYADMLSEEESVTVFAPTDEAFAALPESTISSLINTPFDLQEQLIIANHIVRGRFESSSLSNGQMIEMLNFRDIRVSINSTGIFVNGAKITITDIEAENGIVHVIDAVLMPDHDSDIPQSVYDVIAESEVHQTLTTAILAAGLEETLSGEGQFTIFAPTDLAFEALSENTLNTLLADGTGDLTQILLYHVLDGRVISATLSNGQTVPTLNGADIEVTIDSFIYINDAEITTTDIVTGNGIVHIIDAVLLPSSEPEQPLETLIFETYNWLGDAVNSADCTSEKVTVYQSGIGGYEYIYIEDANGGLLYTDYGLTFCTSSSTYSCVDAYRLSTIVDSWSCTDGDVVNPPPVSGEGVGEIPQELKDLEWLNDLIDFDNCLGSSIEVFDFGSYSFVYVTTNGATTMYLNNGTFYCENGSSYNCKSLYGISIAADLVWNCGGVNKNTSSPSSINTQKTVEDNWSYELYPNPTVGLVYLKLSDNDKIEQINIYDMMGKVVLSRSLQENTTNLVQLNLNNQANGLYMVELISEKTRLLEKLIIE